MPMQYSYVAIPEPDIPRASDPTFQHLLDIYTSETNKTYSVWTSFAGTPLDFRPHPRSSSIIEILRHQLLSERRFFGEFLSTPEPHASSVLPSTESAATFAARLVELAAPRLDFLASQDATWWLGTAPFFDVERERIWIFWRRVLHSAHHRTQLTVYQRLIGENVLPTYGPTADVSWEGADPTLDINSAMRP